MATDSTLQKIADNLLAQFDKTLLDLIIQQIFLLATKY